MSAKTVRLMGFDVDGVFTDGILYYGPNGDALKAFNILDGIGLKLLQKAGIQVAIITGRKSPMVEKRFEELDVNFIFQAREDKGAALLEIAATLNLTRDDLGYMGDDYPTQSQGGHGAVRELAEFILIAQGLTPDVVYRGNA